MHILISSAIMQILTTQTLIFHAWATGPYKYHMVALGVFRTNNLFNFCNIHIFP